MTTILAADKLKDKARELRQRAAAAANPQVRAALEKSAREHEERAKIASGDARIG